MKTRLNEFDSRVKTSTTFIATGDNKVNLIIDDYSKLKFKNRKEIEDFFNELLDFYDDNYSTK